MEPIQRLYYALGNLAYAVAKADGKIQNAEKRRLNDIVVKGTEGLPHHGFSISQIIFRILDDDKADMENTYEWAMKEIRTFKSHMTADMREEFPKVLENIAAAFPPIEAEEQELIQRFKNDLAAL